MHADLDSARPFFYILLLGVEMHGSNIAMLINMRTSHFL
jgi:hypothetical protein